MTIQYLSLAAQGKNVWWRYGISILLISFFVVIISTISYMISGFFLITDRVNLETYQLEVVKPLLPYLGGNFSYISFFIGLYIAVCFVHQRRFITLVTPNDRVRWKRTFQGFGLYFLLISVATFVEFVLYPSPIQLTFKPVQFLVFLPIALVLTSIQSITEELFFRGYLMQGVGLKTKNPLIPVMVSSLLFMLLHLGNPEVKSNFFLAVATYLSYGILLAFITVRDNSLELAMGVHAANNLFVALILNYHNSALPSPSILTASQSALSLPSLISFIVLSVVFCFVIFKERPSKRAV